MQLDGGRPAEGFPTNDIKTAKYNPATFLPKFLWEMFSRAAYLYFLFQVLHAPPVTRLAHFARRLPSASMISGLQSWVAHFCCGCCAPPLTAADTIATFFFTSPPQG